MEEKVLQILVQGGLASVALLSLYLNYKIVTNHMIHEEEAMGRLEVAITKLLQFLEDKLK